jgi:hypothetical protein
MLEQGGSLHSQTSTELRSQMVHPARWHNCKMALAEMRWRRSNEPVLYDKEWLTHPMQVQEGPVAARQRQTWPREQLVTASKKVQTRRRNNAATYSDIVFHLVAFYSLRCSQA